MCVAVCGSVLKCVAGGKISVEYVYMCAVHNTGLYDKLCEYGHYTQHTHTHTKTYSYISFARLITVSFRNV